MPIPTINQEIFDNSVDLLLVVDSYGRFTRISPSSKEILGYEPEEMIGKLASVFLYPPDLENTREMMRQSRRGHTIRHFDSRYVHKNGSIVILTWTGVWSEKARQHFFIGRDITRARALEEIEKDLRRIDEKLDVWSGARVRLRLVDYCWLMELLIVVNSLWACWVLVDPPSNFDQLRDQFFLVSNLVESEVFWGSVAGFSGATILLGLVGTGFVSRFSVLFLASRCFGLVISGAFWLCMGASAVVGNSDTLFGANGVFQGSVALLIAIRLMMFI